jgi:hypothetical protein
MNRKPVEKPANHTEIDHILAAEEPLVPSSGFLASVMESVREESVAPAPIQFPWRRIVPAFSWPAPS